MWTRPSARPARVPDRQHRSTAPRPRAGEPVFRSPLFRSAALLLFLLLSLPLPGLSADTPAASSWSDTRLARFAQAERAVQQLRLRYLDVFLQDKQDGRDSKMSETAMQIDMAHAVEAAGLDLDDYNRIAHAVATDTRLRQRLDALENAPAKSAAKAAPAAR